jgi:hypothetical protein
MSTVTVSDNAIRIPNPALLHLTARLAAGVIVALLLFQQQRIITESGELLRQLPSRGSGISLDRENLVRSILPALLCLWVALRAALFSLRTVLGSLQELVGWIRTGGTDAYAGAPATLADSRSVVETLFKDRSLKQPSSEEPSLLIRTLFGNVSHWFAPSAGSLLTSLDVTIRRLLTVAFVLFVPPFLPDGWLRYLLDRAELDANGIAWADWIESLLRWPIPVEFLFFAAGSIGSQILAVNLVRGKPVQIAVSELRRESLSVGHPDEFFERVSSELRLLRRGNAPNREVGSSRKPGVGIIRDGDSNSFSSWVTIETQPVPVSSGRSLPALCILAMGTLLSVSAFWMLLGQPRLFTTPFSFSVWFPILLTARVGRQAGEFLRAIAWQLCHTFRFTSDLVRVEFRGQFFGGRVGTGDGRGGTVFGGRTIVETRAQVEVFAARLLSEVSAPENQWPAVAAAMAHPRRIIDTSASEEFGERIDALFAKILGAPSAVTLPRLDTSGDGGLAQIVTINQSIKREEMQMQRDSTEPLRLHSSQQPAPETATPDDPEAGTP